MALKVLSVNICETAIKLSEVSYGNGNVTIHKAMTVETPKGTYEDGYLRNIEELSNAIKTAKIQSGIKTDKLVFSIYSSRIATREVYIPVVKENRISEIINTNATEYFPVNIEDYVLSYTNRGVEEREEGKKLKILVYAVPEVMIATYYELAESLGMTIQTMDFAGNSSMQIMAKQINAAVSLIVHIEREYSIVSVYKDNQMRIQRIVPYGKEMVISAMLSSFGAMDKQKAVEILSTERIIHNTFDGDEVTESLRYLINNINRVIDYYSSKYSDEPIEVAYITGESVELLGIENLCANEFKLSVIQIMNLNGVLQDKNSNIFSNLVSKYALCIGALLKPCGFVTKTAVIEARKKNRIRYFRVSLLLAVFIAVVLIAIPLPGYINIKGDVEYLKDGIKNLQSVQKDVDDYFAYKDAYNDMAEFSAGTVNNNSTLTGFIEDLEKISPSDMSIKSMSISDGSVNTTGFASSKDSVAKYIIELKKLSYVSNVYINTISEAINEDGVVTATFSISYTIAPCIEIETEEAAESDKTETAEASDKAEKGE